MEMASTAIVATAEPMQEIRFRTALVLRGDGENGLSVYDQPNGECFTTVAKGRMVEVGKVENGWALIRWDDMMGYVRSECIALYNGEAEGDEAIRSVVVSTNVDGAQHLQEGMVIILYATLTGFENDVYTMQWQYSPDGGETAVDIEGATGNTYAYRLTVDNFDYMYRVVIHVEDEQTSADQ